MMLMPMLTLTLLMKMMMPTLMVLLMLLLLTTTVTQMMGSLVSGAEPTSQLEPGGPKYPAREAAATSLPSARGSCQAPAPPEAAAPSARGSCHLARGRGTSHSSEPWLTAD